jgi:hypothetical protein
MIPARCNHIAYFVAPSRRTPSMFAISRIGNASSFKTFEGVVVGAVPLPVGWVIGRPFGKIRQPNVVFGPDAVQLGMKRVGHSVMPLGLGVAGGLASLYGVARILHDEPSKTAPTVVSSTAPNRPAAAKQSIRSRPAPRPVPMRRIQPRRRTIHRPALPNSRPETML